MSRSGIALLLLLVLGILLFLSLRRKPTHEAEWSPEQARLPRIRWTGERTVTIEQLRDFRLSPESDVEKRWRDERYDLDRLASVWLAIAPFKRSWRGPAHVFLTFGFRGPSPEEERFLGVSIEARRRRGQKYSPFLGLFRRFELMYVLAEESDLLEIRAVGFGQEIGLLPLALDRTTGEALLRDILRGVESIAHTPEFYHTILQNCATAIRDHLNSVLPAERRIGWTAALLLPGYADRIGARRGWFATPLPASELRRTHAISPTVRAHAGSPELSRIIRAGLSPTSEGALRSPPHPDRDVPPLPPRSP